MNKRPQQTSRTKPGSKSEACFGPGKIETDELTKILRAAAALPLIEADPLAALTQAGAPGPLLLVGSHHLRAKRIIEWIKKNLFQAGSWSTYFGTEITTEAVVAQIRTALVNLSLFSRAQLLIIYEADKIKAAHAQQLAEAAKKPGSTYLILTAESFGAKHTLPSLMRGQGSFVEFNDLSGPQLRRWIQKEAGRHSEGPGGISGIEDAAVELLVSSYGSDVSALAAEIAKLALLTPAGGRITKERVEEISVRTPEAASFSLVHQIAKKDAVGAVGTAQTLIDQGMHPLQISAFLNRCIRTLLAQSGTGGADLAPELANAWFVRNLGPALRAFSPAELSKVLALLAELDFQLKDSKLPDKLVLSNTVQRLALRAL